MNCNGDHENRENVICALLGVKNINRIQIETMQFIPYKILIRKLVIEDAEKGLSMRQMATKYRVTKLAIQWILDDNRLVVSD